MKKVILLIFILLLSSVVMASDFSVSISPIKGSVFKGESASFLIKITNNANQGDNFQIKSADLNWIVDDSSIKSLSIGGKKTMSATIMFNPMSDLKPANYGVVLNIVGSTSNQEKILPITLIDPNNLVSLKFLNSDGVDPRRPTLIKLQIKNNYDTPLNIKYSLSSEMFQKEGSISLEGMDYKVEEFTLTLDPKTQEGSHDIDVKVSLDNKVVQELKIPLIIKYYPGLREIITSSSSFLLYEDAVKKINEGNSIIKDSYIKQFSLLERLFTKANPEANSIVKEENKYIYKWDVNLNPQESVEIKIITDYRTPILIFIVLALIIGYAYSLMRRHIEIQKKVLTLKSENSINKIKILLTIKNKTGKNLKNVKIMERLPMHTKNPGDYGTSQPTKIVNQGNLINLIWIIPQLSPKEERVFSYKIESKAKKLILPPALAKYNINDKTLISNSNRVVIQ